MADFQILFDHGEPSRISHPAYGSYGNLGFPEPPPDRPWIYSNFVQSLDGIASLRGRHPSGSDIAHSREDRWLMDLLRAHADAVLMGLHTLTEEAALRGRESRGPRFRIADAGILGLRQSLGLGRETYIFVTASGNVELPRFAIFDGDQNDAAIITTRVGAARISGREQRAPVRVLIAGEEGEVDLLRAVRMMRQEMGIRYLLCEGGPTLNAALARAQLIDERFLTVSPVEVGQFVPEEQPLTEWEQQDASASRVRPTTFHGPGFTRETMTWWRWISCRRAGDHQFNRYRRR